MKNPQEILKELIKEAADNVDGKFDYTSDPTTIVAERFAQQYIDANKELVEMLEYFVYANMLSVEGDELAKELIAKHKQDEQ